MSVALKTQEAGTSKSGQRNPFSSESEYGSTLTKAESKSTTTKAKQSEDKSPPKAQEAEESTVPVPESFVESYTIGWICALPEEFQTAKQMLDEKNLPAPRGMERSANDNNTYMYGKVGGHFVVVGCLPRGRIGLVNTAKVATDMVRSFPSLKFALLVGTGGGAPTQKKDVRLGDVVVSTPSETHGGVVQLDVGVKLSNGLFKRRGHLNGVPDALLSATGTLGGHFDDPTEPDKIAQHMRRMDNIPVYQRPAHDRLYRSNYEHVVDESDEREDDGDWTNETAEDSCHRCDGTQQIRRRIRDIDHRKIHVHYGTIASANYLLRDAKVRDQHANDDSLRVLCFEMEAAGLMNSLPCIVIRGISDYADSHKNDDWKHYAALAAAAYARELLLVMEVQLVVALPSWVVAIGQRTSEQFSNDTYDRAQNLDGTCEWLFVREEFRAWVNTETHPVLWLSGKHGAGKTVLCAAAIRHLLKTDRQPFDAQQTGQNSFSYCSKAIVQQFFSKDEHITLRRSFGTVASQLVDVLLKADPATVPTTIEPFLNVRHDTCEKLQDLIHALLLELPLTFIFVDGLDEAEYVDPEHPVPVDHQPTNEVNRFVEFLIQQAHEMPSKVRVWLSSQPLPAIRQYICAPRWSSTVYEIPLTTNDTERDIIRYFSHKIPISFEIDKMNLARMFLRLAVQNDVQGSFLWATHMASEFSLAEDADDLIELATTDLPLDMGEVYARIMNRIIMKDSRRKHTPLWRVVLSLLAFARRPMRLNEVFEAVAIYRTPYGSDIRPDSASGEQILSCCLSLIRHTPETDFLRLSHSAVRTFVLDPPTNVDCPGSLVDPEIIQVCCLQYLLQPKYKMSLEKTQSDQYTLPGDRNTILSHTFLLYAAKYWYLHHDSSGNDLSAGTIASVCQFVKSANFRTILQVQSLFIESHFLMQFDSITDRGSSVRRTLPNWMHWHSSDIHRQYHTFQGEWCRLLQAGRSDPFRGELDRCFWRALGPSNFLYSKQGRYHNFEFSMSDSTWRKGDGCHSHCLSRDGTVLWLAWIRTPENNKELCFEEWTLDGKHDPYLSLSTVIPFSASKASIDRYVLPCSETFRTIPVVPQMNSLVPPDGISIFENGSIIRVGHQMFKKSPTGTLDVDTGFHEILGPIAKDAWELVCHRAPFTVVCRRRLFREQPDPASMRNESSRVEKMRQRMSEYKEARLRSQSDSSLDSLLLNLLPPNLSRQARRELGRMSNSSSETSDQSSDDSSSVHTESPGSEASDDGIGLAEESWSEVSSCSDESSSDSLSGQDEDGYFGEESDDDSGSASTESESEESISMLLNSVDSDRSRQSSSPDPSDFASAESDQEYETSSSDDLRFDDDVSVDDILDAKPAPLQSESGNRVTITPQKGRISCDSCNIKCPRTWYHCMKCQEGNVDICERCEKKGMWCLDVKHQLYKMVKRVPLMVVSRRNFDVCQELAAFQTDSEGNQTVAFRFKKNYSVFLHDSPPVIHETYPLIVWALTGSCLVFGDIEQNKCFEQNIKTASSKKARPICVNLSFSPCGTILRMAVIDAVAEKVKTANRTRNAAKSQLCLNLHVLLLRLSSSQPARSLPKLLGTVSCRLDSSCARAFVSTIPFAFTWSSSDLYLTISDSYLHVYRISFPIINPELSTTQLGKQGSKAPLDKDQQGKKVRTGFKILVLQQMVLLPHSSRHRSVQFFPAPADESESKAKVVIGPRYGRHPTPPIGVYLSEKDVGGWVDLTEKEDDAGRVNESRKKLADQFEEGWDSDDCIIIPYDGC
ncbi:hypothetical protein FAVG1_13203 [Fusarium avenaceum]|nr:hypothetical protein FAVG1_13203 [Fusarium avenaceum]